MYLVLSTLSIQTACFKLLQQDGVIDPSLSLRECYNKYLSPDNIDYNNPKIWESIYNNDVLSIFQWDQASGRKGVLAAQPQTLDELSALNGMIRLMTEEGTENQIERFIRIKENPQSWIDEMNKLNLPIEVQSILHEELDRYNGCAAIQESFMILIQRIAGYSLSEAEKVRKVVAKKAVEEIEELRKQFREKCQGTPEQVRYLYDLILRPSEGYAFNKAHADAYSIVGVQCVLLGAVLFPKIYWQTACLLQRSGSLDGKMADYNKIAKAVAELQKQNVDVRPPDINLSQSQFTLNAEKGIIYYGLDAVKGVKSAVIERIYETRPYTDIWDFYSRVGPDIASLVALIKCGAFDELEEREATIDFISEIYLEDKGKLLKKLNGQNLARISREGLWPEELDTERRIFNFTNYLKKLETQDRCYILNDRAKEFLEELGYNVDDGLLSIAEWKASYDYYMIAIKDYLKEHQEEMLRRINLKASQEFLDKYFHGAAYDEIETLGICFAEHPYKGITKTITPISELPEEPIVQHFFQTKDGRSIPMYELFIIAGIVIAKDKLHHTVTLLCADGPINVKMGKEQFAHYDCQISNVINGKKTIIERSWFNRGTALMVHGLMRDESFIVKHYKNSKMKHGIYKITDFVEGKPKWQEERKVGVKEEEID